MSSNLEQKTARGLLEFASPQQTFDVGGVQVGGVPGISPTVMIGSVFYHGHKVNTDEDRGEFDRDGAKKAIEHQDEFSELTGNPCMLDVVGATPDAIVKHLEFAAQVSECPLLIDGTTDEVRLAGLKYVAEAGLADRVVYNSIQPETSDEELQAISDAGVEAAILLAYYLKDFSAKGRVLAVEELLPRAHEAGIRSLMVDTCVLDLATMGQASGAMFDVKDQYGLPAGGGVHNAVAMWKGLKNKMGEQAEKPCVAAAMAAAVAMGADFLLYGPVEDAKIVFPAVAMIDTSLSQLAIERGTRPEKSHPRFRIG